MGVGIKSRWRAVRLGGQGQRSRGERGGGRGGEGERRYEKKAI